MGIGNVDIHVEVKLCDGQPALHGDADPAVAVVLPDRVGGDRSGIEAETVLGLDGEHQIERSAL